MSTAPDDTPPPIINAHDMPETERMLGRRWGASYIQLTPSMGPGGGRLGVNRMRLPAGRTTCPFHYHEREDEVFYVLSGRGVLRHGESMQTLRPGDCVSCPAGTATAHQIANPFDEDLVYLAIGLHDPDEVCVYPDSGKVLVRSLGRIGWLESVDYLEGEPDSPRIFELFQPDDEED